MAVIFAYMGWVLYRNWGEVPFEKLKFSPLLLVFSYIFMAFSLVLSALGWKLCLETLGERVSLKRANQILSVTRLGGYVPGKVWTLMGTAYFAKKNGISEHKVVINAVLETILAVLSALLMLSVSLTFIQHEPLPTQLYLVLILIPLCFVVLQPSIFTRVMNWGLVRFKLEPISFHLYYTRLLELLGLYCFNWFLQGLSFYLLVKSFYGLIGFQLVLPLSGLHALAWVIGFLSFVTPGGLGVREGALSLFLNPLLPPAVGIVAVLLLRVWSIIGMASFVALFGRGLIRELTWGLETGIPLKPRIRLDEKEP